MKNSRKIFVAILLMIGLLTFVGCKDPEDFLVPGSDHNNTISVKEYDNLKIIFGEDYLYSNTGKASLTTVSSGEGPEMLYLKQDLIEFIPEVQFAEWEDTFENCKIKVGITKNFILIKDSVTFLMKINNLDCYIQQNLINDKTIRYIFEQNKAAYGVDIIIADTNDSKLDRKYYEEVLQRYIAQLS